MVSVSRSALVMYSVEQMFDLVNNVGDYPNFISGCRSVEVLLQTEDVTEASLTLSKVGVTFSLSTHNELERPSRMTMTLKDGPFSHFLGVWQFDKLSDEACKVTFELQFTMTNRIAGVAVEALLKQIANSMVDNFVKRAKQLHG